MSDDAIERAAEAISKADALFIGAGAGMGVDSGLPDFRGDEGFWRAYPPFRNLGANFFDMANPKWFEEDPALAWGFYGHRLNLYRETEPHAGFDVLRRWGERFEHGSFVFTSNVDGQFQRAGFDDDSVVECHGSIHHLQCTAPCHDEIWDAASTEVRVTEEIRATDPLPGCQHCAGIARPNILMFGDVRWLHRRAALQEERMGDWFDSIRGSKLVVVECGAGTAVPTVRWQCERVAATFGAPLIRINPRESHGPAGTVELARGALDALTELDEIS